MYFDIRTLPFKLVYDLEELEACFRNNHFLTFSYKEAQDYQDTFIAYDTPDNADNMKRLLFDGDESAVEIIDYSYNSYWGKRIIRAGVVRKQSDFDMISTKIDSFNDIVCFTNSTFSPRNSSYFYDLYKDDYDYIVLAADALPRTPLEGIKRRISGKKKEELDMREVKRCFPGIKIKEIIFKKELV